MRKLVWLSLIASSVLLGNDQLHVLGSEVDANGSVINASGDPVVIYKDQILSADTLRYDRNTSVIEAFGGINVFKAGHYHAISEYGKVDLLNENRYFKPYYLSDQTLGLWMSAQEAQGCKSEIDLEGGTLSGCNPADPEWMIRFSSADYDTDAMWVNLYNARLEVGGVPVFYLPYFGYPTDISRRSGLLIPSFGLSNSEGFYYLQPIYYAPTNWWDLELRPQIRTSRGAGLYSDFRFVDTPSSEGTVRVGYFREQSSYAEQYDLASTKHYGYNVHYTHKAPLQEWFGSGFDGESGLYVDGAWMNDVDYLNLQHSDETKNITDNQVISRINAFYSSESDYLGLYMKHYQYLDKENNNQTIQTLPSFQYHRYLDSLIGKELIWNMDAVATNFFRLDGKNALKGELNLPITYQTGLMDDYLEFKYSAGIAAKAIGFYGSPYEGDDSEYKNGLYTQLDHILSIGSTLVKPYQSVTHVVEPFLSYKQSGTRLYRGYYKTYHGECDSTSTSNPVACEYYDINEPSDTLSMGVNNYIIQSGREVLVDRLSQNFNYNDQGSYYGELRNELELQISEAVYYYNLTAYNHDRERITKEQNTLRYNEETVTAGISHYYTDEVSNNVPQYLSYLTADFSYQYDRNYRIFGEVAYDYQEDVWKRGIIGVLYSERCFDLGIKYVQNRRPISTSASPTDSINESYLFFTIVLKPIGGSDFNYKLNN